MADKVAKYVSIYCLWFQALQTNLLCRKDATATNPRGIPYAPFVDRVEDYVTTRADVEAVLKNFQEMISYVSCSGDTWANFD
jgi:hypothetical protein